MANTPHPLAVLTNSGLIDELGSEHVFDSLDEALQRAGEIASMRPTTDTHPVAATADSR